MGEANGKAKEKAKAGQRLRFFLKPGGVRRARLDRSLALFENRVILGIAWAADGRARLLSSRVANGFIFRHPIPSQAIVVQF